MSNRHGYIGTAGHTQAIKSNSGVFSPNEVIDLDSDNVWFTPGQLELIETQTISSGSTLDFTNIQEVTYNIHFATLNNIESSSASTRIDIRFSNDNGSSYESGNDYQRGALYGGPVSTGDSKHTATSSVSVTPDSASQSKGAYCYFYNLGDSTKYSFITFHGIEQSYYRFGGGVYKANEQINGIRFFTTNSNAWTGTISLYGIKEYS